MRCLPVLFSLTLLFGCVQTHTYKTPFVESEFRPYAAEGTATVTGQAFATTRDGEKVHAAGNEMYLIPVTDYTREWYRVGVVQGKPVGRFDERIYPYLRFARAGDMGQFEFTNIPEGQYYVATDMSWRESSQEVRHATACAVAYVKEGETVEMKVTQP